jgi:hypothetical protein
MNLLYFVETEDLLGPTLRGSYRAPGSFCRFMPPGTLQAAAWSRKPSMIERFTSIRG